MVGWVECRELYADGKGFTAVRSPRVDGKVVQSMRDSAAVHRRKKFYVRLIWNPIRSAPTDLQ